MSEKSEPAVAVLATIGAVLFIPLAVTWGGFCLELAWNWCAAPFTSIRLTAATAVGLSVLVSFFRAERTDDDRELGDLLVSAFTKPAVLLIIAFIAHLFMARP